MAEYTNGHAAPVEDDIRYDDTEYNPAANEKKSAKAWLNLLEESRKAFEEWNDHAEKTERLYGNLEQLTSMHRPKEFQIFWANMEILRPSIYAKAPVPVVVPKFKDRRELYNLASEVLERATAVAFDVARINDVMYQIRDDLTLIGRGVCWVRYESGKKRKYGPGYGGSNEKICIEFKHRKDFLHSVSRCWYEVSWVAAASYLTRAEARKRFYEHSGDEYKDAEYKVWKEDKEVGGADDRERAAFWEVWSKTEERVVWVAEGCENILDEGEPHLALSGFFPCPAPVYATCQRGSLIPIPDVCYYRDQLQEVNQLTGRIHALSESLQVKGFYPASGEQAEALETALKLHAPGTVLVPISNWAMLGGSKDIVLWMPIDMISTTITALVALRKEIVNDIQQVVGLSDIMRGATEPEETFGAQQLKSTYGSVRIRDKQGEMVRVARDLVQIVAEIVCSEYSNDTIMDMCQLQIPTQQQIRMQMANLQQQIMAQAQELQQLVQTPQGGQLLQQAQQNPEMVSQVSQMVQAKLAEANQTWKELSEKPTQETVLAFLRDNRARSFVLDIETDSTIQPDEMREKKQRAEYTQALSLLLPQLSAMVTAEPATAPFAGEMLKFSIAPFKVGRQLDSIIDEFVERLELKAGEPPRDPKQGELKAFTDVEMAKLAQKDKELQYAREKDAAQLQYQVTKDREDRRAHLMEMKIDEQSEVLHAQQGARTEQMKERQGFVKIQQDQQAHQQKMAQLAEQTRAKVQTEQIKVEAKQQELAMKERIDLIKAQTAAAVGAAKVQNANTPETPDLI